jgi:hypothetical protein
MKRRNFLEKTLATSGALLVPGASIAAINSTDSVNQAPVDKNDNETIFDEVVKLKLILILVIVSDKA